MRIPNAAHTARPWRIHELTHDFILEDVWALPTPGGPDDFPRLIRQITSDDAAGKEPGGAYRILFAIRWTLGALFGWDKPGEGVKGRVPSLRDRLPADLRDGPRGPDLTSQPFTSIYLTDNEWALEIANHTVHAIMHFGWVQDGSGGYRGQMAVLVQPNGAFGKLYLAGIKPFRYLLVYPAMLRLIERNWKRDADNPTAG